MKFQHPRGSRPIRSIPTIGLLCGSLSSTYLAGIWKGVVEAAHHRRIHLICFRDEQMPLAPSGHRRFAMPHETIYDMVDEDLIDGLLVVGPHLLQGNERDLQQLCASYAPLPVLTIAARFDGIPAITSDNTQGLHAILRHVLQDHEYRRIVYLKPTPENEEVRQRYQTYAAALQEWGGEIDPNLVISGGFNQEAGVAAVRALLDDRQLQPGRDFDAILASNDFAALGAMRELQRRGVGIPADVAVMGYDDVGIASQCTPSLTTVRQPIYELGYRAVELLLAGVAGDDIPESTVLPTSAVLRLSCGCLFSSVTQAAEAAPASADRSGMDPAILADPQTPHYDAFYAQAARVLSHYDQQQVRHWMDLILEHFIADVKAASETDLSPRFLKTLDAILRESEQRGGDPGPWHTILTAMREYAVPYLDDAALALAEDLWQQARVLVAGVVERHFSKQLWQDELQMYESLNAGQNLSKSQEVKSILRSLADGLAYLRIPAGFLCLHETPEAPNGFSRLALAYRAARVGEFSDHVEISPQGRRFLSRQLLPEADFPRDRPACLLMGALVLNGDRLGHAVFEIGPLNGDVYETMCHHLSSALKSEQLLQAHLRASEILGLQPIIEEMLAVATNLGAASEELRDISSQMAAGAEQTLQQASNVSTKSREINRMVQDMSKAVEAEAGNIQEISATVTKVGDIITQAVSIANAANDTMTDLESHSQQIGNIIKTITDIADQTDLLALNATIKAAQAGEYGRGFAVVAENVKELAGQASQAAEDIEHRISTIQANSLESANAIMEVVHSIREVSEQSGAIAASTQQQTATTNEISSTMSQVMEESQGISQAMAEVVKATQQSSNRAGHVQQEAEELSSIAEELRQLVQEVRQEIRASQSHQEL